MTLLSPTLETGTGPARTVQLALAGSLATLGTRSDGLMEGEGADLPLANLGYHVARPNDAFGSLESLGARVAFARANDARVRTRAWSRSTDAWAPEVDTRSFGGEVRWLVQRVSSGPKPEEILAAQIDTGAGAWLEVRTWDARRWSDDPPAVLTSAIAPANAGERAFDVGYEALSGRALLVRADGASNVLFQTLVEGEGVAAPVFTPALATGTVLWTELVPRTGTDEIALVALDDAEKLHCSRVGTARSGRARSCSRPRSILARLQGLDAAWESSPGDLLVAWATARSWRRRATPR